MVGTKLLKLRKNEGGLWWYGSDLAAFSDKGLLQVCSVLEKNYYLNCEKLDNNRYAFTAGFHPATIEVTFEEKRDNAGKIKFIYLAPDGKNEFNERRDKICQDLGAIIMQEAI